MSKSPSLTSLAEESGVSREEIASDMRSIAGKLHDIVNSCVPFVIDPALVLQVT